VITWHGARALAGSRNNRKQKLARAENTLITSVGNKARKKEQGKGTKLQRQKRRNNPKR